jgi:hypothetical protein
MLYELYGLNDHELVKHTKHIRPRQTLRQVKPLDTLIIQSGSHSGEELSLPAYLYRETLAVDPTHPVMGIYKNDNAAGIIVNHYGKGRTLYCGALAGIACNQPAVVSSTKTLPSNFSEQVRHFLTTVVRWANIVKPVQSSDPLVETQLLSGVDGDVVILINWNDAPVDDLVLAFPDGKSIRSVRSLKQAGYFKGYLGEQTSGVLPLVQSKSGSQVSLSLGIYDFLLLD